MNIFRCLAFSALLAMSVSSASAQDFDKGWSAYELSDFQTAFKEWMPLAEIGDGRAQSFIGLMYSTGDGVIQSDVEAFKWLKLAADQGYAQAQGAVGERLAAGLGVKQNILLGFGWLRLAAYQGDARSQTFLGTFYEQGAGVIQNDVIAHMWYNIGSANGEQVGAKARDEIAAKMTEEEIAKAQVMAQECMSSGYKSCGD